MPSAGRTSMPTSEPAPLTSTFDATFQLVGSMVTIDLPSTRPTTQPAAWAPELTKADAASAPASVNNFICLNMEVAPVGSLEIGRATNVPAPMRGATGAAGGGCRPAGGFRAAAFTYS